MTSAETVLFCAWKRAVTADNAEDGFGRIRAITGRAMSNAEIADAVAECLRDKLIHEPVRLPDGALQCAWTLELTPDGVDAVRDLLTCES